MLLKKPEDLHSNSRSEQPVVLQPEVPHFRVKRIDSVTSHEALSVIRSDHGIYESYGSGRIELTNVLHICVPLNLLRGSTTECYS